MPCKSPRRVIALRGTEPGYLCPRRLSAKSSQALALPGRLQCHTLIRPIPQRQPSSSAFVASAADAPLGSTNHWRPANQAVANPGFGFRSPQGDAHG
jgi:hypothetical protein